MEYVIPENLRGKIVYPGLKFPKRAVGFDLSDGPITEDPVNGDILNEKCVVFYDEQGREYVTQPTFQERRYSITEEFIGGNDLNRLVGFLEKFRKKQGS